MEIHHQGCIIEDLCARRQYVIQGNTPSKSNCYRIITFRSKNAKPTQEPCEHVGCDKGFVIEDVLGEKLRVPCPDCKGTGIREVPAAPRASLAKSADLKKYEKSFKDQWKRYKPTQAIKGDFEIEVDVYYPSRRSDLDNSLKVLLDCLQDEDVALIPNDNACMRIIASKFIDKENPRIEFTLREK